MPAPAIQLIDVSYRYPRTKRYVISRLNLTVQKGELMAVMGENGAGKSTLCQLMNGIIPHSLGGKLKGKVLIDGIDTQESTIAELATHVGIVLDDPETQLFTTTVLSEVAFGPENLGVPAQEIRERIAWALDIVGLTGFEDRSPTALSGGQKQRLAIAAALAMKPSILVLDEATSQLDPLGVVEVLRVVRELNVKYGMSILMATDHGEEVAKIADRALVLHQGQLVTCGSPREIFSDTGLFKKFMIRAPQVSQLGARLAEAGKSLPVFPISLEEACGGISQSIKNGIDHLEEAAETSPAPTSSISQKTPVISVENLNFIYQPQKVHAVRGVSFSIQEGECVALIGQNGSGKTTILKNMLGLLIPSSGKVLVAGMDTHNIAVAEMAQHVGFVLQNPDQQLFAETVEQEIAFGPHNLGLSKDAIQERVEEAVEMVGLESVRKEFPPALSKGDRAKVVIASALALRPEILVLDEPTTGQDYKGCHQIMQIARTFHQSGRTVVFVTHHMALVAEYAQRAIVLCNGQILLDDRTERVFAQPELVRQAHVIPPQITELGQALPASLGLPRTCLTVAQMANAVLARMTVAG
ncbi:MAG: ATP-binding cassette domain-containing protein [Chloroflexi bacterium]|nr:MAG: ATP-binding cassette domain-containing protein [Chloroflexota bacterium]